MRTVSTSQAQQIYRAGGRVKGGQAYAFTAGMAHGTKVRGTAAVKRAARKARNKAR